MQHFTRDEIIAHRFTSSRRKGYDTLEVDAYLEALAEYVGWIQGELARHQATERTALEVLQRAQRLADETIASAERDATTLRRQAVEGMENARKDARAMLDAARADADRTLLSARVHAEATVDGGEKRLAELEAKGVARTQEFERIIDGLRKAAAQAASEFRSAGAQLVQIAEHFDFEVATRGTGIGESDDDGAVVELSGRTLEVS